MLEPFLDLLGGREDDLDVVPEREAQIFDRLGIERIDQRDADRVVADADRQRAMQPRETGGNQLQDLRRESRLPSRSTTSVPSASAIV